MKRGVSQIDWIVSLAIFILYIGWFFAFIIPSVTTAPNKDARLASLKKAFLEEYRETLTTIPVFVEYNGTYTPVVFNFSNSSIAMNTPFVYLDGRIVFGASMEEDVMEYTITRDGEPLEFTQTMPVTASRSSGKNMSVYFSGYKIDEVYYNDTNSKIRDSSYTLNGEEIAGDTYSNLGFASMHVAESGNVNITTLVFEQSSKILVFIDAPDTYQYHIYHRLDNYPNYFVDNNNFGTLHYTNETQSLRFSADSITFYGDDYLHMELPGAFINISYYGYWLYMDAYINVSDYMYSYEFYEDARQGNDVRMGVQQVREGIGEVTGDYEELRKRWGNFRIDINGTVLGPEPPDTDVYADTFSYYKIEDGEYIPISINMRIW